MTLQHITLSRIGLVAAVSLSCITPLCFAKERTIKPMQQVVDGAIRPLMAQHHIPGMSVAIIVQGKTYFFNYGVAETKNQCKVTQDTLFEIGSVSKTFTATLGTYAQTRGKLKFSDPASQYLPALKGSAFDRISLLELGTYTAGGLPLQFPNAVRDQATMVAYYKNWRPAHAAGTHRQYSNPSIGLFGYLAAVSMGEPFETLMSKQLFPALGLNSTYINVPQTQMHRYAYGYSKDGKPIRVTPGVLDAEAYGVKTSAADMIRFVGLNIDSKGAGKPWQQAIALTQTGYFRTGGMTQGLGWEMYDWPAKLDTLLAGNSSQMSFNANAVTRLTPPKAPQSNAWFNKTGATNGFGAYAAFVPSRRMGIVMLANKNYPNADRVTAAYRILTALESQAAIH